jgi:hypothetical protein
MDFDLVMDLGAAEEPAGERLTLYLPAKDRKGALIVDHHKWLTEGQELLTDIGDGASCFPPVTGTWRKPDGGHLWEQTTMIYCYIDPKKFRPFFTGLAEKPTRERWSLSSAACFGESTIMTCRGVLNHDGED